MTIPSPPSDSAGVVSSTATGDSGPAARPEAGLAWDGAALGASALLTALAGLVGWLIAARMMPQSEVGAASAFVNSFMLIAALAELGLGPALLRWLPLAGGRTLALLQRVYPLVIGAAALIGLGWHFFLNSTVPAATSPLGLGLATVVFVLAAVGWVLFHLQDEILTGIGLAKIVPVENVLFAGLRLVLLVVLGPSLGALGVVLSWVLPTVLTVLVVSIGLFLRSSRRVSLPGVLPTRPEIFRLVGPIYPASIGVTITYNVIPLIVTARFGTDAGAAFFVVWMGLNALDLAANGYGNAMVIRLVATPGALTHLLRRAGTRIAVVAVPVLAVAFALAGVLLGLFGDGYREAAEELMRWILVGFLARVGVLLVTSVHLGAGRGVRMAVLQLLNAAGLVLIVASVPITSLTPVGIAFVGWQLVMLAIAAVDLARLRRR
ncbi:MAG: lipopolysaccharide biosynthesis protein [Propionibacteriaceae bacterium]